MRLMQKKNDHTSGSQKSLVHRMKGATDEQVDNSDEVLDDGLQRRDAAAAAGAAASMSPESASTS